MGSSVGHDRLHVAMLMAIEVLRGMPHQGTEALNLNQGGNG